MAAVRRANALFRERAMWLRMVRRAMTRDFSWAAAARRYAAVYRELRPDLVPA
jgi:glycogen synthase